MKNIYLDGEAREFNWVEVATTIKIGQVEYVNLMEIKIMKSHKTFNLMN